MHERQANHNEAKQGSDFHEYRHACTRRSHIPFLYRSVCSLIIYFYRDPRAALFYPQATVFVFAIFVGIEVIRKRFTRKTSVNSLD
ncbi:hypothetical protein [Brevibacillus formosus]|uniref:hypothetical protein n=1 Tax=Brevibacillus formosus TaxID=54913 RepID=UPI0021555BB7|nr:hypothetical protein [Brevibacillus formosus]